MSEDRPVLIVERGGGRTTVVTGWRAALLALGVLLSALASLALLGFVFIGLALTIGAVLLVVVPAAIAVAIIGALPGRR